MRLAFSGIYFTLLSLVCACTNGKLDYINYRDRLYTCQMGFFVSTTQVNGAIGIANADAQCKALAGKVGDCSKRPWHAYLSTSTVNARDRIGGGPWYNVAGQLFAQSVQSLYATTPQPALFLNELGQDASSISVWTGSTSSGVTAANTCNDFTSTGTNGQYGFPASLWSDMISPQTCSVTQSLYCFATD